MTISGSKKSIEKKNFTYGDIWKSHIPEPSYKSRMLIDPEEYTSNASFLNFLDEVGYNVYIDYNMQGTVAFTDTKNKTILLNGNYKKEMIEPFLQHELGHLMLFDVNTFTTIKEDSLRSIIAKVIYTIDNVKNHGIGKLFYIENIVQDVIIETVSGNSCVCANSLAFHRENMGVKHLENLEDIKKIAKEVCNNLLKNENIMFPQGNLSGMKDILDSMLDDLKSDISEIEEQIYEEQTTSKYHDQEINKILNQKYKIDSQSDKLRKKLEKIQNKNPEKAAKIQDMLQKLKKQLKKVDSLENRNKAIKAADQKKSNKINSLKEKLKHNKELLESLEQQDQDIQRKIQQEGSSNQKKNINKADDQIHANLTDHLSDEEDNQDYVTHTFDCGLPYPQKISRNESYKRERNFRVLNGRFNSKKLFINRDSNYNVKGFGPKSPEKEFSYFRSNKREFSETDMLKGRKPIRLSGINVLIGLDVSGSMNEEWTSKFNEISILIETLKDKLDIEDVVYFTYNNKLVEYSDNISSLSLTARGGNAFGYVYQQAMEELPIRTRNEIILITDCGDNLGFSLGNVCETNLDNEEVINHISVIDTESSGFYAKREFDNKDWALYASTDRDLHKNIKNNIETLIEK